MTDATTRIDDGGPAFPGIAGEYGRGNHTTHDNGHGTFEVEHNQGISLRDYFAAKAMQAFCPEQIPYEQAANMAYKQADAMLAERNRKQ